MLDTFDHVVVLMLENRSFDNVLGYMYPNGVPASAPLGKTFEGVTGQNLSNPVPPGVKNPPPPGVTAIPVSPVEAGNYFQPYPDPGENYVHVNTQLFYRSTAVKSRPTTCPASARCRNRHMEGFVADYIENYKAAEVPGQDPTYDAPPADFPWTGYKQIMQCYPTSAVPVVTTLATEFGVFDHWFCAVPSETWCNRTFWNAGTSWGFVINPPEFRSSVAAPLAPRQQWADHFQSDREFGRDFASYLEDLHGEYCFGHGHNPHFGAQGLLAVYI